MNRWSCTDCQAFDPAKKVTTIDVQGWHLLIDCYETIMFGRVTHTLDAAEKWVRSFVLRHSHSVTSPAVVL